MKACFVGVGSIGKRHIKNLNLIMQEKGIDLTVDVWRSSHRDLDAEIKNLITRECYSVEELDREYDAIFITNPTNLHFQTIQVLKGYSRFFFVEKPIFDDIRINPDQLGLPADAVYYVACPLRYTKVLRCAKDILERESAISVRSICSSYLPDWRPNTDYKNTYSAHKDQGGGVKIDLIHEWDYLTYLFGFPKQIYSMAGKYSDLEIDSEDIAVYIAEYMDKLVELHLDYCGRQTRRNCEVITNQNVYCFDIANGLITKNGQLIERFHENPNDKYLEEMRYFYSLMCGNESNTNDIQHAVNTLKLADS